MKLNLLRKAAFGIGAIGKDMVYMLSASFVMYYYQDILGFSPAYVGLILMIARVFDALNDPFMGVLVAKTSTRWGRFRPWLFSGTVLNAVVLYALFAAPVNLAEAQLMVYFAVVYILWGVTYTMMDIPFWSMIPAVTDTPADRENLSVIGRTCAGIGSALISMLTMLMVGILGGASEREGFRLVALIIAAIFLATEIICCLFMKERPCGEMKSAGVKDMFTALFHNDQALIVVLSIVLINMAMYITAALLIYFFKYDFGGAAWKVDYTKFTTVGGGCQILGMMVLYPMLRRFKVTNERIFRIAIMMNLTGYGVLLAMCLSGQVHSLGLMMIPCALVFGCSGVLNVLTTVFLSNSVDYGELQTGRREESVIFSMQTFVVKAASGVSVFIAGLGMQLIGLQGNTEETGEIVAQSASTLMGLRLLMTLIPIASLLTAVYFFRRRFALTDKRTAEIAEELAARRGAHGGKIDG